MKGETKDQRPEINDLARAAREQLAADLQSEAFGLGKAKWHMGERMRALESRVSKLEAALAWCQGRLEILEKKA